MLEENYQEIQSIYQNYRYTYHDIKNHLIILLNYCNEGEYKKAARYIEKISNPITQIEQYFISDNKMVDIILNYKFEDAKKKYINLDADIDHIGDLRIDEDDICVILANLMDNAIEACQSMDKEKRWINVVIKRTEGILLIDISNSCFQKRSSLKIKKRISKDIIHGYGIKSVESKVKRYGGNIRWRHEENKYVTNITFFNVFKNEKHE